jgi:hypothetical protein
VSVLIGIAGFVYGLWRTFTARRVKELYEWKLSAKSKDIYEIASLLSDHAKTACEEVNSEEFLKLGESNAKMIRHAGLLIAKVEAIAILTWQLIRFCERFDEEHRRDFGKPAIEDLDLRIRKLPFMIYTSRRLGRSTEVNEPAIKQANI